MSPAPRIGPGAESVHISLYAPDPTAGRWDRATWDGGRWGALGWRTIDCEVLEAQYQLGATDEAGILSTATAGQADLLTLDPDRILDPTNTDSPYFGSIRPGTPVRVLGFSLGVETASWTGFLDEASYDVGAQRGRLRAIDGIAYLAQATVPQGTVLPNTLRARTRAVVAAAGLTTQVPVQAEVADMDPDPPVAAYDSTQAGNAWDVINDAAQDALTYVWLGPAGTLRFISWGAFPDAFIALGCPPPSAGGLTWLRGLSTLDAMMHAGPVRNRVRAYSAGTTWAAPVVDGQSVAKYGARPLDIPRVVPNYATWAQRILDDRADAGIELALGEVRPWSEVELTALLQTATGGPSIVRVRDEDHPPLIDMSMAWIGEAVAVTASGWRWRFLTMIPRASWEAEEPPAPVPPTPPPDPWHTETRIYVATSDALLALTSGGANYGAGAANSLPVGAWQGWTYRAAIQFPTVPWTKVRAITAARLRVRTTTQVRIGFGASPTVIVRRITGSWSAGSSSSPSGSNSVVYPGPAATSTGQATANVTRTEGALVSIDITTLARAWAPASVGGSAAAQRGVLLVPGSGSTADTTEFWPVEQGSTSRPQLELDLQVFD